MDTLTVVNRMLGTMGEKPLASLTDTHALMASMQGALDNASSTIQAEGWWYNMETLTVTPNPTDSSIYLPNDCLSVRTESSNVVKRGNRLYNLDGGTYVFTSTTDIELIRSVVFEDLPETGAAYIAAQAILDFQKDYDGDTTKMRQIMSEVSQAKIRNDTAHIRNRRRNLIKSNVRLQQLKAVTRGARRLTYLPR